MTLSLLSSGPITEVISALRNYFDLTVKAFGWGLSPWKQSWIADQSLFFAMVAWICLVIKTYLDFQKKWVESGGSGPVPLIDTLRKAAVRGALLVPIVIMGSAIPMFFNSITPNAYLACASVATGVAGVGDHLVDTVEVLFHTGVQGDAKALNDGSAMRKAQALGRGADAQALATAGTSLRNTLEIVKTQQAEVTSLQKQKDLDTSKPAGALGSWNPDLEAKLTSAKANLATAGAALTKQYAGISSTVGPMLQEQRQATKAQEVASTKTMWGWMTMFTDTPGWLAHKAIKLPPGTAETVGVMSPVAGATVGATSGATEFVGDSHQANLDTAVATTEGFKAVIAFISDFGFYICLLPAILGLLAGAVVCLKEALAILQYGGKLEIMKALTLGLAAWFAPLFLVCFFFEKTEQFGWKFISLMFSVYFAFIGVTYVTGVVANAGIGSLAPVFSQLLNIPQIAGAREASTALFMSSLKIGLLGVGVGMITAFLLDIVKSGVSVGSSVFNGTFQP